MMRRTYESPEFELLKFSFEATMDNIHYSKDEGFNSGGSEGDNDEVP